MIEIVRFLATSFSPFPKLLRPTTFRFGASANSRLLRGKCQLLQSMVSFHQKTSKIRWKVGVCDDIGMSFTCLECDGMRRIGPAASWGLPVEGFLATSGRQGWGLEADSASQGFTNYAGRKHRLPSANLFLCSRNGRLSLHYLFPKSDEWFFNIFRKVRFA